MRGKRAVARMTKHHQDKNHSERFEWITQLSRLEVLEDLMIFRHVRRLAGSKFTNGWADPASIRRWKHIIVDLRKCIPEDLLKEYDDAKRQKQHKEECKCILCKELREFRR